MVTKKKNRPNLVEVFVVLIALLAMPFACGWAVGYFVSKNQFDEQHRVDVNNYGVSLNKLKEEHKQELCEVKDQYNYACEQRLHDCWILTAMYEHDPRGVTNEELESYILNCMVSDPKDFSLEVK